MPIEQAQQEKSVGGGVKGESLHVKDQAKTPAQTADASNSGPQKTQSLPSGIYQAQVPQDAIEHIERTVPADQPPPLAINEQLEWIGKPVPRLDGGLKTTGRARYTADVYLPGMLFATMVSASEPHARIRNIDTSAAERSPGVKGVYILKHLQGGEAELADPSKELPSKYPIIRFAGQPILGVAAVTQDQAEDAARKVKIDYEPLPFVTTTQQAKEPDAPTVYPGAAYSGGSAGGGGGAKNVPQRGNVRGPSLGPKGKGVGDFDTAYASAPVKIEAKYRTQVQTHSALETHGVVADWKPDMLTVYASTQGTSTVRDELAEHFDLPKSKVRVITEFMGGGFGAKFGAGDFGVIATALSQQTGAPVKLMLSRKQEHLSVGMRPDSDQTLQIGAAKDGTIVAMHLVGYGTGGVGTGAGMAGPVQNMYKCANVKTEEYDVFTNTGPAASMRAPGHPQGAFALEQTIDELAEKLGIDPLELRDKNDENPARREERRIGAQMANWSSRKAANSDPGPIKRGLGVAQSVWYRIVSLDSSAEVRVSRDGGVEFLSAVQDIGGGIRTVLAQVVAEELGIRPQEVTVKIGDTNYPIGPASGGSLTTGSITPPARDAAHAAKMKMAAQIAPLLGTSPEQLIFRHGKVSSPNGRSLPFRTAAARMNVDQVAAQASRAKDYGTSGERRNPHITYGGVQFAQVAVDTETGIVKVEKVWAVHDCGRPMNALYLESQINGGILQGISYALYEERIIDRNTGIMVNPNLEQYKIIGSRETPEIHVHVIQDYLALSSTDAGGIGEPSTIATSAAVANAIYNATGARVRQLPMRPGVVLAALDQARKAKGQSA